MKMEKRSAHKLLVAKTCFGAAGEDDEDRWGRWRSSNSRRSVVPTQRRSREWKNIIVDAQVRFCEARIQGTCKSETIKDNFEIAIPLFLELAHPLIRKS